MYDLERLHRPRSVSQRDHAPQWIRQVILYARRSSTCEVLVDAESY